MVSSLNATPAPARFSLSYPFRETTSSKKFNIKFISVIGCNDLVKHFSDLCSVIGTHPSLTLNLDRKTVDTGYPFRKLHRLGVTGVKIRTGLLLLSLSQLLSLLLCKGRRE